MKPVVPRGARLVGATRLPKRELLRRIKAAQRAAQKAQKPPPEQT